MKNALLASLLLVAAAPAPSATFEEALAEFAAAPRRSPSRLTGMPDEDPTVKELRDRFAAGTQPKTSALLGVSFGCTIMTVYRGDFAKRAQTSPMTFTVEGPLVRQSVPNYADDGMLLAYNGKELIGVQRIMGGDTTVAYRADASGALISEYSVIATRADALTPLAAAPKGSSVSAYLLCVAR